MKLLLELKDKIYKAYTANPSLFSGCGGLFFGAAPQGVTYPLITYNLISAPTEMSMSSNFINARVQFTIFINENEMEQGMNFADSLETVFNRKSLVLQNDCTNIGTYITSTRITFFEEGEKVWRISQDYRFMVGTGN